MVEVGALEELQILLGVPRGVGSSGKGINLVAADAGKFDPRAVDTRLSAFDLDLPKTDVAFDAFEQLAVLTEFEGQPVEVGLFGVPL